MNESFRDSILDRLTEDLIGPSASTELLADRPTQRYSTGILYPRDTHLAPQEDEDGGQVVDSNDDQTSSYDSAVSLHASLKPASAGMSFAIQPHEHQRPTIHVHVVCATYKQCAVNDAGREIDGPPVDRAHERWSRQSKEARLEIEVKAGESLIDLTAMGIEGMDLYVLAVRHGGIETVTLALSNQRSRGTSSAYDEEQHFFQVKLSVLKVVGGSFAPRPSSRAETDEDSRTAALIYRSVAEYVVGHTCSARVEFEGDRIVALRTDWIPAVTVPSFSDRGDRVFEQLDRNRVFAARSLAAASTEELCSSLNSVVSAYRQWIERESARIATLPQLLQAQARKHVERCEQGAARMMEGIAAVRADSNVRRAFQTSQLAMALQFGWSRSGQELVWRPFQLAFQLLVLASLSDGNHAERQTMDLLWFPTGGGKTEAYLALTAFIVILRRLRTTDRVGGAGVAVIMRYTLRLLTVQQFQRAAAMICACEMLRRGDPSALGGSPIGIGLWVGAAATPLTLKDAITRPAGDPSTPEQLTQCPCCRAKLTWKLTHKESIVECSSAPSSCAFAASGARLPVWTIDEEVYRHTPSLLIGTIDKFAQIVRKPETRVLFGRGTSNAPPDLIIQDELHLISGPLGSIAGLYEVAIDELCRIGSAKPKIIGSTATIRRAEEQIRSLFDRRTYQFPSPGIDATNSGFAVVDTDRPGRLYIGLTTAGRSATYMLQALIASLLQSGADPRVARELRDPYWTLVAYFNSLRELGRALVLMQDDVPVSIRQFAARRTEQPRRIEAPAELTSRVQSHEITEMLERLGRTSSDSEAVDLLVASNMISVGMDIPRLGLMVVNAQPKTLSEYIQATSRVGRGNVPGLVVTLYNSMRARDRSHYETFETWHQCLYRDVEATSVTPFASRAQDKALHAVLVALVRHLVPEMLTRPVLHDIRRADVESIASAIETRVARVDPAEQISVSRKLERLIDQWASRSDLQTYWDDYNRKTSLLMSAEQFAAKADVDPDLDTEGARRALWPTPNSMREVEPGAPFIVRPALKSEGN